MVFNKISIIIPCYNAEKFICKTVDSFLTQSFENIEIIIQDDCSTDNTWNLLNERYNGNNKVKLFKNEVNLGIGGNWNKAYQSATGQYLIIFNADDWINPEFISKAVNILENYETNAVTFAFEILDYQTKLTMPHWPQRDLHDGLVENAFKLIFFHMPFHWNFTVIKMDSLKKLEITPGNLFMHTQVCDAELWLRFTAKNENIYYHTYVAGQYVKHDTNNSSKPLAEAKSFIYDLIPLHHQLLKNKLGISYKIKMLNNFKEYLKSMLLGRANWDQKLLLSTLSKIFF